MSVVAVLPSIHRPWTDRCVASMAPSLRACLLVVDNTGDNRGVAASWNLGWRKVVDEEAGWLLVVSAACRFGSPGGLDMLDALDAADPDAVAVEAAHGIGWHLIGFRRRAAELAGLFDENFWPAYMEDCDYGRRLLVALDTSPPLWPKVPVDVAIAGFAHGVDLGGALVDPDRQAAYYEAKWGGPTGRETHTAPFGDAGLPVGWWPRPPDPRAVDHAGWASARRPA